MNTEPRLNERIERASKLAGKWQDRANELLTGEEKAIQKQLKRLLEHPTDKVVMTQMIDRSFRTANEKRIASQIKSIFSRYGVPEFFKAADKVLMRLFLGIGHYFPHASVPKIVEKMREDSSRSVIPGEADILTPYLARRKKEGVTVNMNHLGEAVLSEAEAQRRLKAYMEDLQNPDVAYISVKISTLYSQISSLAMEHTLGLLKERLTALFRSARENHYRDDKGRTKPKFVTLDMEEYRDLEITKELFCRTLEEPEFKALPAGIVLQTYLPDSYAIQQELTEWARKRVADGGSPIKLRIVKGANMEMEQVAASLHGWPLAPYDNKLDVDANYKRMVTYGMEPARVKAVTLGIASHNLFEMAYAYTLAEEKGVLEYFTFEMLEGMADHVRRALQETGRDMVVYAPVATKEDFISAIAYLIRRLDENTAPDNFLRHACMLETGTHVWEMLKAQFVASCRHQEKPETTTFRTQNRLAEDNPTAKGTFHDGRFVNEPDTDLSLSANRTWAEEIRERWQASVMDTPREIPIVIDGKERFENRDQRDIVDPNQLKEGESAMVVAHYAQASRNDLKKAVTAAKNDPDGWRLKTTAERHEALSKVAAVLRQKRGDLIGAAMAETGKVFSEADPEVSEAVDFVEYYPHTVRALEALDNVETSGVGVGLVVSPWNFPIAIPCGGIAASLAAGNTVVFKPASSAVLTAWTLCNAFWEAGISKKVLQFVPCSGSKGGPYLVGHPDVDYVILTGGTDTGMRILEQRPGLFLAAETGGKNATIVTAMSDREQAVANILQSAFGHCGQKCSATSLLLLEREIYDDPHFKKQLVEAAQSWSVGSAWNFENRMGPLVQAPGGDLQRGLTELAEEGETWALKPRRINGNPHLWTPGIKWGVKRGSYTHMTEFFGPVLGVMPFDTLDDAIEAVHMTGYGLTSGIESLDEDEQVHWQDTIRAGNLYINRGTTGAIVIRQPFGGMGKSALGAGIKAGGPNYAVQFMKITETGYPSETGAIDRASPLLHLTKVWQREVDWNQAGPWQNDLARSSRAVTSYCYWAEKEFRTPKDYVHLRGQDNHFRYLPLDNVVVRLHEKDSLFETVARIAAAKIVGCKVMLSLPRDFENGVTLFLRRPQCRTLMEEVQWVFEADEALADQMNDNCRIRYAREGRVPDTVLNAAAQKGYYIARKPVLMQGRLELLHYVKEQSICNNYHRYGNLGERAEEFSG